MSEIAGQLNSLANNDGMQKISYRIVTDWLIETGMLCSATNSLGKSQKYPTAKGNQAGITLEERVGSQGAYYVVVYSTSAQHFILEHLDDIMRSHAAKTEQMGKPWEPDHDDHLKELYQKGVPIDEIAVTLKRSTRETLTRLKKLGVDGVD